MRLYELISYPGSGTMTRGKLLIESEHEEAITVVVKALDLTSYVIDKDILTDENGKGLINTVVKYQTTFSGYSE